MSKVGFLLPLPVSHAASSEERKPLPGATLLRKASYPVPKYTIAMGKRSGAPVLCFPGTLLLGGDTHQCHFMDRVQ